MSTCLLTIAGCASAPPPVVSLPNGYYLQRNRAGEINIVARRGGTTLGQNVAAYAVYRDLVVGATGFWEPRAGGYPNALPYKGTPDSRYFILETDSGHLQNGLEEATYRQRLKDLGAPAKLDITAPVLPK
jgi:hypothetical protein